MQARGRWIVPPALLLAATAWAQNPAASGTAPPPAAELPAPSAESLSWPRPDPGALSPRIANYRIRVTLDHASRRLVGRQELVWTNAGTAPADELRFHLYWNAWANNRSTWMLEDRFRGRSSRGGTIGDDDWGWLQVDAVRLPAAGENPAADLTPSLRYLAPDDGNREDRTVMAVSLPRPVLPGETIRVELDWRAKVPRTFARTGFRGDFYFIAHWFPKLGVWQGDRWHCRQYHSTTEFFSDFGVYDVEITLPAGFVLGATGRRVDERPAEDGKVTYRHVQEDVHGFAWTASPSFLERRRRFEAPGLPPVDVRLLVQPEHLDQADRHFDATDAALELYGRWFGPYPYGHLTVVDPAWGSGAGGMEYPTLFTAGTRWLNPPGGGSPEGVTIHEAGHQFWYGIVANNEFDHAWIDEGLTTYSTGRVYQEAFGDRVWTERYFRPPGTRLRGFVPWQIDEVRESWAVPARRLDRYRQTARSDIQATPTFRQWPATAANITYSKTALYLMTLERYLGWETLRRVLSRFFERAAFRHPRPEELHVVAEEVTGRDLSWFFDQVWGGDELFDYAVTEVRSDPIERRGFEIEEGEFRRHAVAEPERYRTEVVVRRLEDGVFPVEVLMVFEDGTEVRRRWSGREPWRLFVEERSERLDYAVVDPERVLMLDLDYGNNSRLASPRPLRPAVRWASRWLVRFQDLLTMFGFFV